jgi:hypothetical protein
MMRGNWATTESFKRLGHINVNDRSLDNWAEVPL